VEVLEDLYLLQDNPYQILQEFIPFLWEQVAQHTIGQVVLLLQEIKEIHPILAQELRHHFQQQGVAVVVDGNKVPVVPVVQVVVAGWGQVFQLMQVEQEQIIQDQLNKVIQEEAHLLIHPMLALVVVVLVVLVVMQMTHLKLVMVV
jgi:hypothetical protein